MASRKRSKTSAGASSSSSAAKSPKWQQRSAIGEDDDLLFNQDWEWERHKNDTIGEQWQQDKHKRLSSFNNRAKEIRLWKYKMTQKDSVIPELCVMERVVNSEEFWKIGITQRFHELGWAKMLDWCEVATSRVYLPAITTWLASLKFENKASHPSQWRLVGDTGRGQMVMSFDTINRIAGFDSLGTDQYTYYPYESFLSATPSTMDPPNMVSLVFPHRRSTRLERNELSLEGKILQNISLENIMVRKGDRGKVRMWDCRVLHALLFGLPRLSWRHIVMMNIWETRELFNRLMIPYPRLISAMIIDQGRLPADSLWVEKPLELFDFRKLRSSKIFVEKTERKYVVRDTDTGLSFTLRDPDLPPEQEEEALMIEDEEEHPVPTPPRTRTRQRFTRPHREISDDVSMFIAERRPSGYDSFTTGNRYNYDNTSAVMGEAREREMERMDREREWQQRQEQHWDAEEEHWTAEEAHWAAQEAYQQERDERFEGQMRTLATNMEMHANNAFLHHEQERHHRDFEAGRSYQQFAPWTDYSDIRNQPQQVQQAVHWPQGVASSYVPIPTPPQREDDPLFNFNDMMSALTGYPYQPYPPRDPNERYQR